MKLQRSRTALALALGIALFAWLLAPTFPESATAQVAPTRTPTPRRSTPVATPTPRPKVPTPTKSAAAIAATATASATVQARYFLSLPDPVLCRPGASALEPATTTNPDPRTNSDIGPGIFSVETIYTNKNKQPFRWRWRRVLNSSPNGTHSDAIYRVCTQSGYPSHEDGLLVTI
ncbi:MAG: hypothetical protein SH847_17740 [Roseiflexaceae bacterium]|nr:hypothetical protein [Roseiflexaceae bacterium]